MGKYNHACSISFTVISDDPQGNDFTPAMLREALFRRIADLDFSEDWVEAVGAPFDTYEEEEA